MNRKKIRRLIWIFIIIGIVGFIYYKFQNSDPWGGREIVDISNDGVYKKLIGKIYQTQTDLLIKGYIGDSLIYLTNPGGILMPTINEARKIKKFPSNYNRFTLYGVLPEGSKFKIVKVLKIIFYKPSQKYEHFPYLVVKILSDLSLNGNEVLLDLGLNATSYEPLEKYAVPIESE